MIRKAKKNESLENLQQIATLIYNVFASKDTLLFLPQNKVSDILFFQEQYLLDNHYYSYENYLVKEENNNIIAIALIVRDDAINQLNANTLKIWKDKFGITNIKLEKLSQTGELYLEVIAVHQAYQGKGIGTDIINYIWNHHHDNDLTSLSLNVYFGNHRAKVLYEKLGFKQHSIITIYGKQYYHMVKPF
ncbi:GNAT family N-acetyltransferase [Spiroplasma endosymbiont of Dilophus febrilis]|uniref:GNAT family N-acetyltransferase n=1 Tax=Spiroplasma endosymbiont of Dilophus febrilis TaxID=3066292 RepID=UPI00313AD7A8